MKIAIDCRMSGKSGIGTFLDGVLPYMLQSKHTFLLIAAENFSLSQESERLQIVRCTIRPFSMHDMLTFPHSIAKEINRCDVYFTPYCNIPSGIRIPVATTIHDIVFLDIPELAGKLGTLARYICYKYAVIRSNMIFTVSHFSAERIRAKLGCKKPLHIVHNGIPAYLTEKPAVPMQKQDKILFIGNIKKHKGLQTLLKAFTYFRKTTAAQLVIVGNAENFRTADDEMTKLLSNAETKDIVFTGYISDADLHLLLRQARMLVQPSRYEGFGIPPLEALVCGTPVVLSDIPVFKEIYGSLPVHFFKCDDEADLTKKIKEAWPTADTFSPVDVPYSYERTAQQILKILSEQHITDGSSVDPTL